MLEANATAEDIAITLNEGKPDGPAWRVVELRACPDYRLFLRFADGIEGYTEMREMIFSERAGVFAALRDPKAFSEVSIDPDFGSVVWSNGLDIAPDATHKDIQMDGVQILR